MMEMVRIHFVIHQKFENVFKSAEFNRNTIFFYFFTEKYLNNTHYNIRIVFIAAVLG